MVGLDIMIAASPMSKSTKVAKVAKSSKKASANGIFLIRVTPVMHTELKKVSNKEGISVNEYCRRALFKSLFPKDAAKKGWESTK